MKRLGLMKTGSVTDRDKTVWVESARGECQGGDVGSRSKHTDTVPCHSSGKWDPFDGEITMSPCLHC